MLVGLNVSSGSCISELIGEKFTSFLHLCFHLSWKHVDFNWLTHTKKLSAAKSDKNIIQEERSIKAAEKDPSVTIVASACLTGPTVVGCVNVTEFWQMQIWSPSFLLLLNCKMYLAIPQWLTLCPGSQMIYYNYCFYNSYFHTCFLHWCAVFHRNNLKRNKLFYGCLIKKKKKKLVKEAKK